MIVVRGTEAWASTGLGGPVLTIGNFDGVHRGHQALLRATRTLAASLDAPAAVLTFDPAPRDVLRPGNGIPRIQSLDRKLVHLERAGVDAVVVQPFDHDLAGESAEDFAGRRLRDQLGVRGICIGHDFRFGRKRSGDARVLREVLGVELHEETALVDPGGSGPISSSRIREALSAGDVAAAAVLLGRPHELLGEVVSGDQRGRLLGFPTANLRPRGGLLPPSGVYAVRVEGRGGGVANFGRRPTFTDADDLRLEVHLLDFDGDLYGAPLVVHLVDRIRDERRFEGTEALREQIERDVAEARRRLGQALA